MGKVELNAVQRLGMLFAALLTSALLWQQIEEYGLDETHWIIGILTILALAFVAASGMQKSHAQPSAAPSEKPIVSDQTGERLKGEFLAINQRLEDFLRAKLKTIPRDEYVQFVAETSCGVSDTALLGSFMLTLICREQRSRGYVESVEVGQLRLLAVGLMTNNKMEDLRRSTDSEPPKRADMIKLSAGELVHGEIAVRQVLQNVALAAQMPLDPIFEIMNRNLPIAENGAAARHEAFGAVAQEILAKHGPRDASDNGHDSDH